MHINDQFSPSAVKLCMVKIDPTLSPDFDFLFFEVRFAALLPDAIFVIL